MDNFNSFVKPIMIPIFKYPKDLDLGTIKELMQLTVTADSFEDLAQRIVDLCADILQADLCTLWRRLQEDGQDILVLNASKGFKRTPGEAVPTYILNWDAIDDRSIAGVTAWIAIRKTPCRFNNFLELKAHPSHRGSWDKMQWDAQAEIKFKSLIGIPLLVDREMVGVLKWENSQDPAGFSEDDFTLTKELAPFIAIALQSMNFREHQEKNRQEVLKQLTTSLLSPFEPRQLYREIVETTAALLHADLCSMWLCDDARKFLRLASAFGVKYGEEKTPSYRLNWNAKNDKTIKGLTAWVAIRGRPYFARYFQDLKKHPSWKGKWDKAQFEGRPELFFGSFYAVPLKVKDIVMGVLRIERRKDKPPFSDVNRAFFDLMANFIVLGLELSNLIRQEVVFDFFHLLKQPASNCLMVFSDLRQEVTRSGGPRQDRVKKRFAQLAMNLESLRSWTNNVYALASGLVTGREEKPKSVGLGNLIDRVITELKYAFPNFILTISPDVQAYSLLLTPLEEKKVQVILYNIMDNSIKFSLDQPKINISVGLHGKDRLGVTIEDQGRGISKEELPYIFDPYFKRPVNNWPESMGLGLTTVRNLLQEFNWDKLKRLLPLLQRI